MAIIVIQSPAVRAQYNLYTPGSYQLITNLLMADRVPSCTQLQNANTIPSTKCPHSILHITEIGRAHV